MTMLIRDSSQPYLFKDNNQQSKMLYCYANDSAKLTFGYSSYSIRPWKIYVYDIASKISTIVNTITNSSQLGSVVIECNPQIQVQDNYIKVYYIAGFRKDYDSPITYYLCSFIADNCDFNNIRDFQVIHKTFSGTICGQDMVFVDKIYDQDVLMVKNLQNNQIRQVAQDLDLIEIVRVCTVFDSNKLIVTGKDSKRKFVSFLLNSNYSVDRIIKNIDGYDIYKCSIMGDILAYTIQNIDQNYESRSVVIENL